MTELPSVYIETSVISYLAARPSNDLVVAGHQQLTWQWWDQRRDDYRLFVSQPVVDEAARGHPDAARRRLAIVAGMGLLQFDEESIQLSKHILKSGIIPKKAETDAAHVAIATRHGMEYLATWNCRHIANAIILRRLAELVLEYGYELPIICTPYELFGEYTSL